MCVIDFHQILGWPFAEIFDVLYFPAVNYSFDITVLNIIQAHSPHRVT